MCEMPCLYAKDNDLPLSINWNKINDFLLDSEYGVNMPEEQWFMINWVRFYYELCRIDELEGRKTYREGGA